MEWLVCLRSAIDFMEKHMLEPVGPEDVAKAVNLSPFYLQKGFQIITGYSLSEYIRCRRLYLAALDLLAGNEKVIDIAYKYCYQTPESFTKAFIRFHGFSPSQARRERMAIQPFLPLKIKISIQGGKNVDFTVEKMEGFRLIGFKKEIPYDKGYEMCPQFWNELNQNFLAALCRGKKPETELEKAICECSIGMFGACMSHEGEINAFTYLVAGPYDGRPVPEGLEVVEIPAAEWAKFRAVGPMPGALQTLNTQIFQEWLPGNQEYELAFPVNLEYYSAGEMGSEYESGIWLPVVRK